MSSWTLADIRQKVRRVTGRLSPNELSNRELDRRINRYYLYTFPAEVKLDAQLTYYEFLTTPNEAIYEAPKHFTNFEPPLTVDRFTTIWHQNPTNFFDGNPEQVTRLHPWVGDGATTSFTTQVQKFPMMPGSFIATDGREVFEDSTKKWTDDPVTIDGSLGGSATINYKTGDITVTFSTAVDDGQKVSVSYILFKAGRPVEVLYYDSKLKFYPVPDTAYRVRIKAYAATEPLVNATDTPPLEQWGPCIAYGTARDLHADFGEFDAYREVTALYKEQISYVLNRTTQNLLNTRAQPQF